MAVASAISVALCTRNGARFVEEQLRSILTQTLPPVEIVLSDDASSDDTIAIAERVVAGSGVELRLLRNDPPLGVVANFAQALTACRGELIALCDQDDRWEPDRLERAAALLESEPGIDVVHSDARLVDADGADTGVRLLDALEVSAAERAEIHAGRGLEVLLRRNVVTGATMLIRRGLVERAAPFPPSWVHDEWLAIVAALTTGLDLIEAPLIDYRQHGGNQIGASRLTMRQRISKLREPRQERNEHLVARGVALLAKAQDLGAAVAPAVLADVEARLAHDRIRLALPAGRLRRIGPVLREGAARYRRYSRGYADMLRDLAQPAGDAREGR